MQKKIPAFLLSFLVATLVLLCAATLFSSDSSVYAITNGDYEYELNTNFGTATIIGYTGSDSEIGIPNTLDGYPVDTIGKDVFKDHTELTYVAMPENLFYISEGAFSGCSNITTLVMNSVLSIRKNAFYGCNSLTTVRYGLSQRDWASVMDGEDRAGNECFADDKVTITFRELWYGKYKLRKGIDDVSATIIDYDADEYVPGSGTELFDPLNIPEEIAGYTITGIGTYAFRLCDGIPEITIPDTVTTIGESAFEDMETLDTVYLSNNLESIGDQAFSGSGLKKAPTLPKSLRSIGNGAFSYNYFTSFTIPDFVTSIGTGLFAGCTELTQVTLPSGITEIPESFFSSCESMTSFTVPETVTSIGSYAFYGCNNLNAFAVPETVKSIGDYAFKGTGFERITFGGGELVLGKGVFETSQLTRITLPTGLTEIPDNAFYGSWSLEYVGIPDTVEKIGEFAFGDCECLESIYLPTSLKEIGRSAFRETPFTSISIPEGVKVIPNTTFYGCGELRSVTFPDSLESIQTAAFGSCTNLDSITITKNISEIDARAFEGCSNLYSISVDSENTTFDSRDDCNAIIRTATDELVCGSKNTVIPDSVKSIGDYAFHRLSDLYSINIPSGVKSIGDYAFYKCNGLTTIVLPNGFTSLGEEAFSGTSIEKFFIPASLTSVQESALRSSAQNHIYYTGTEEQWNAIENIDTAYNSSSTEITYNYTPKYMSDAKVTLSFTEIEMDYETHCPVVQKVTYNGETLIPEQDYTVSYEDDYSSYPGTYRVTIKGLNDYISEKVVTYTITPMRIAVPKGKIREYTGKYQYAVDDDYMYYFDGEYYEKAIGDYICIVSLNEYYIWEDGTTEPKEIHWSIREKGTPVDPDPQPDPDKDPVITCSLAKAKYVYDGKAKTPQVTVKADSEVLTKGTDYEVTYPAGRVNAGTYKVLITLTGKYQGTKSLTFTITKAANPVRFTPKTGTVKYKKVKKVKVSLALNKVLTVAKAAGKVTYKKTSGNKKITVSSTGKVTVKKGLKKGTYKITVKATAAATANYKAATKKVTFKVKVK